MMLSSIVRRLPVVLVIAAAVGLAGCAPSVSTTIQNDREALGASEPVGVTADSALVDGDVVGSVRVKEAGLSINCSRSDVWSRMRDEARKAGANVVLITESKEPDLWSSCYRAEADLYRASPDVAQRVLDREPQDVQTKQSGITVWSIVGVTVGAVLGYALASLLLGG
jgi:hypothetical protein